MAYYRTIIVEHEFMTYRTGFVGIKDIVFEYKPGLLPSMPSFSKPQISTHLNPFLISHNLKQINSHHRTKVHVAPSLNKFTFEEEVVSIGS